MYITEEVIEWSQNTTLQLVTFYLSQHIHPQPTQHSQHPKKDNLHDRIKTTKVLGQHSHQKHGADFISYCNTNPRKRIP